MQLSCIQQLLLLLAQLLHDTKRNIMDIFESYTQEKVYFVLGPEFGSNVGDILIIKKALYGLRSSGLQIPEGLSMVLHKLRFFHSKVDPTY